ncbi:MAG: hypothetical protein HY611_06945, partial [Elusimicrobia bacterium]|nr:hypothetical protein [Elusimicrobiota bacterium]
SVFVASTGPILNPAAAFASASYVQWSYAGPGILSLSDGASYRLVVQAADAAGNLQQGLSERTATYVEEDTAPPGSAIESPGAATVTGLDSIFGSASDNKEVASVEVAIEEASTGFWWDGQSFAESLSSIFLSAQSFVPSAGVFWTFQGPPSSSLSAGDYAIYVRATDGFGNAQPALTSKTVQFQPPDLALPVSYISAPSGNTAGGLAAISGSASDDIAVAAVEVGLQNLATELWWNPAGSAFTSSSQILSAAGGFAAGPAVFWTFAGPSNSALTDGVTYKIVVMARDSGGNAQAQATEKNVTYAAPDNLAPSSAITSPSTLETNSFASILGTAMDNKSVQSVRVSIQRSLTGDWWNGSYFTYSPAPILNLAGGFSPAASVSWTFVGPSNALLADGETYEISVQAKDASGNLQAASTIKKVRYVEPDYSPPLSAITTPETAAAGSLSSIAGTAIDNRSVASVKVGIQDIFSGAWWNGSGFVSSAVPLLNPVAGFSAAYFIQWSYAGPASSHLADGRSYRIVSQAVDQSGNAQLGLSERTVTFRVADTTPPTSAINSPAANSQVNSLQNILGVASDNVMVSRVELGIQRFSDFRWWSGSGWVSYQQLHSLAIQPAASVNWSFTGPPNSELQAGISYVIHCQSFDSSFLQQTEPAKAVVYFAAPDTELPQATISFPAQGALISSLGTISGTAWDNKAVKQVKIGVQRLSDNAWWNGYAFAAGSTILNPALSFVSSSFVNWTYYGPGKTALTDGNYRITAQAFDTSNNAQSPMQEIEVRFSAGGGLTDREPPYAYITQPFSGESVAGLSAISGSAYDNVLVSKVKVGIQRSSDGAWWNGSEFAAGAQSLNPSQAFAESNYVFWGYAGPSAAQMTAGAYRIVTQAQDASGNLSIPSEVSVSYSPTAAGGDLAIVLPGQFLDYSGIRGTPETLTAGVAYDIKVVALGAGYGGFLGTAAGFQRDFGYTGTVDLVATDPQAAIEPAIHAFSQFDYGEFNFKITFHSAGEFSLTAEDARDAGRSDTQAVSVESQAELPGGLVIVLEGQSTYSGSVFGTAAPATVGAPYTVSIKAVDGSKNINYAYTGRIRFTSGDPYASVPEDYTFAAYDNGARSFSVTFNTEGGMNLRVEDVSYPAWSDQKEIQVNPAGPLPGDLALVLSGQDFYDGYGLFGTAQEATAGVAYPARVAAVDAGLKNKDYDYAGAVTLSASGGASVQPSSHLFSPADNAEFVFSVTFVSSGSFALTAGDAASASRSDSVSVKVQAAGAAGILEWSGRGADNLASNPANWAGGKAPGEGDQVVFGSLSPFKNALWDVPGVRLASFTIQAGYYSEVSAQAPMEINGALTLRGGTFNGGSFMHRVHGDWIQNGGKFIGESATVSFVGSRFQTVSGDALFGAVRVEKAQGSQIYISRTDFEASRLDVHSGTMTLGTARYYKHVVNGNVRVWGGALEIDGGRLEADTLLIDGTLQLGGAATLEAASIVCNGTLRMLDAAQGPSTLTRRQTAVYAGSYLELTVFKALNLSRAVLDGLNSKGLQIQDYAGPISVSSVTFQNFQPGASAVTLGNLSADATMYYLNFADAALGANVAALNLTGANLYIADSTGTMAGSKFEKDPNNRIVWNPDPTLGVGGVATVYVAATDLAPSTTFQGAFQLPVLRLGLWAQGGTGRMEALSLHLTGDMADSDILRATLWQDSGNASFSASSDTVLAAGRYSQGAAALSLKGASIGSATQYFFITYDYAETAGIGRTAGAALNSSSDFSLQAGRMAEQAGQYPLQSSRTRVELQIDTVTLVSPIAVAPSSALQGQANVPMLQFALRTLSHEATLANLTVDVHDTQAGNIQSVSFWKDLNANGKLEASSDLQIGSASPNAEGQAMQSPAVKLSRSTQTFFVAITLSSSAAAGSGATLRIEGPAGFGLNSPDVMDGGQAAFYPMTAYLSSILAASAERLVILKPGLPTNLVAGSAYSVTVNALNGANQLAAAYNGAVKFQSSDAYAVLPASYSFLPADGGSRAFQVAFKTAGSQTLSVEDTVVPRLSAGAVVTVNASGAWRLLLLLPGETAAPGSAAGKKGTPLRQKAGKAFSVSARLTDAQFNPVAGSDIVGLTSSDAMARLPAQRALYNGELIDSVTLWTPGSRAIAAKDLTSPSILAANAAVVIEEPPPPTLYARSADLAGPSAVAGQLDSAALKLELWAEQGQTGLKSINVRRAGSASDTDVLGVRLFRDNGDGAFDPRGDFSAAQEAYFSGGQAAISLGYFTAYAYPGMTAASELIGAATQTYFLSLHVANAALGGRTFGLEIQRAADFILSAGTVAAQGIYPLRSGLTTIKVDKEISSDSRGPEFVGATMRTSDSAGSFIASGDTDLLSPDAAVSLQDGESGLKISEAEFPAGQGAVIL